ncbi:DUF3575 domain-containing protein [Emticicia sp. W12TSBA100-4]|uniref:DUF3575 domain-containing protein n=1 Tax=Emticicia sp. W12TSBA100-4 TaxID=3160965 RepID=UPI0033065E4A
MRKILFLMMVLPLSLFAQEDSLKPKVKKNEIMVNAFELIVGGIIPISYEHFINNYQSIVVKTFFLDKPYHELRSARNNPFSVQIEFLYYTSEKKRNAGFFVAPFLKVTAGKYYVGYFNPIRKFRPKIASAGFGVGYKFLIKEKFLLSITTDIGRIANAYAYNSSYGSISLRAGINMGLRF